MVWWGTLARPVKSQSMQNEYYPAIIMRDTHGHSVGQCAAQLLVSNDGFLCSIIMVEKRRKGRVLDCTMESNPF